MGLTALLLVPSLIAAAVGGLGLFVLLFDGALLAFVALEALRLPRARGLEVLRELPERIGLSRSFERRVRLTWSGAEGLSIELHEDYPRGVDVQRVAPTQIEVDAPERMHVSAPDRARCDDAGRAELARHYVPHRRGRVTFGDVRVAVRGRLGLLERQVRLTDRQELAVEPALASLRQTLALAASERWLDLGVRRMRPRGGETEFESLREYVAGDDVRRVDWKAFARRGKPMVREFEVERGQELILLIDRGRAMRMPVEEGTRRGWTKLDWALDAGFELAAVALSKGDRVGMGAVGAGLERWVAARKGRQQLARLSRQLFDLQPGGGPGDLGRALRELAVRHRRRATVIVLSDVSDPLSAGPLRTALARASSRHRIVFAALDDPELREAAAGHRAELPAVERAASVHLVRDRRRALRSLATSGARIVDALPAEAAGPLLAAWLEERRGVHRRASMRIG